jgi:hypothetical protein
MGEHTSTYTTASIALRITWPRKPHHYVMVEISAEGSTNYSTFINHSIIDGAVSTLTASLDNQIKFNLLRIGLRAGRPEFDSRQCKIFLFSTASTPILWPTQLPIQWVPEALSSG